MATSVTPDAFLAALTRWGLNWRFYKDRADWLTHNRNGTATNSRATPGGFGPLRGVVAHNTASTAQAGMIDYLYRGDTARELPGPLAHAGILKTGEVVLLGWGTTNHAGPSDPIPEAKARANALPLDSEIRPRFSGTDPRAILVAPFYLGFEACYSSEGPTDVQYRAMVAFTCACLEVMGGPADGYGAGSVLMHRELTTTRSDPQGVARDGKFRRDVAAALQAGPPNAQEDDVPLTAADLAAVQKAVRETPIFNPITGKTATLGDFLATINRTTYEAAAKQLTAEQLAAAVAAGLDAKITDVKTDNVTLSVEPPATP